MPARPIVLMSLLLSAFIAGSAAGGGGPENLMLVVNQNSDASRTIANHYIRMRKIPPTNVVYLDWQGSVQQATGEEFRTQILQPIIDAIDARRLAAQIDYVAYSADFPWRVDFREDFADQQIPKQFRPVASLTGATYLWAYALRKNPAMVMPDVNWYVPPSPRNNQVKCQDCTGAATRAFRSRYAFLRGGKRTTNPDQGRRYLLSTMLGVTVERGNTEAEILSYLGRSIAADATHPQGTFYFMKNRDVRSQTRHDCFPGIVEELAAEGARAVVRDGVLPAAANDVLGLMTGTRNFDLDGNLGIAAGAICDHFTSSGAAFSGPHQTKLSEFLRAGAAGASGTVWEPFAMQAKFPLPTMHLHYRRGASLAEAFYQSIAGPYQLLIVGDPLCQPWARPPQVELQGLEPGQRVSGVVEIKAQVEALPGTQAGLAELFVDGRLVARYPHMLPLPLDTSRLAPGYHELRVVAATDDPLEFRGRTIVPIEVAAVESASQEDSAVVRIDVQPSPHVAAAVQLQVAVSGPSAASSIDILQNQRVVGRIEGSQGAVGIEAAALGRGPVALVARANFAAAGQEPSAAEHSLSEPAWFLVQ